MTYDSSRVRPHPGRPPTERRLDERCIDELQYASGTSVQIADRIGEDWKIVAGTLSNLYKKGKVDRIKAIRGYIYSVPGGVRHRSRSAGSGHIAGCVYARQYKW